MWESFGKKEDSMFSGTTMSLRCYESHPMLKLGKGKLYGGSASHPKVKDADVYVSLQYGSSSGKASDPWEAKQSVVEVQFSISDMTAPTDVPRFKKLVTWICTQLQDGKKVHVGCIGGHGRTGTLISAIVAEMNEEKDAIKWVRKHYCKKAVESRSQVQFLVKHYGVSEVSAAKEGRHKSQSSQRTLGDYIPAGWEDPLVKGSQRLLKTPGEARVAEKRIVRQVTPDGVTGKTKSFAPMAASSRSVWRRRKG